MKTFNLNNSWLDDPRLPALSGTVKNVTTATLLRATAISKLESDSADLAFERTTPRFYRATVDRWLHGDDWFMEYGGPVSGVELRGYYEIAHAMLMGRFLRESRASWYISMGDRPDLAVVADKEAFIAACRGLRTLCTPRLMLGML